MSEPKPEIRHYWSDAWLLVATSLASASGPASIGAIIAAADGIQHAIPTFDEVDGGLSRLAASGLLRRDDQGLWLTERGLQLVDSARPGSWLQKQETVTKALGAASWTSSYRPADAGRAQLEPVLTKAEFDAALKGYKRV